MVPRRQSKDMVSPFVTGVNNLVIGTNEYEAQIGCGIMLEDYPEYCRYPVM